MSDLPKSWLLGWWYLPIRHLSKRSEAEAEDGGN